MSVPARTSGTNKIRPRSAARLSLCTAAQISRPTRSCNLGCPSLRSRPLMRLLVVAPNIPLPGAHGGSTHVTELVRALRRHNDVMVLARRGSSGAQVVPLGLGTAPGPLAYALAAVHLPQALLAARSFRPDAIY